jgi:hypothetical protein
MKVNLRKRHIREKSKKLLRMSRGEIRKKSWSRPFLRLRFKIMEKRSTINSRRSKSHKLSAMPKIPIA